MGDAAMTIQIMHAALLIIRYSALHFNSKSSKDYQQDSAAAVRHILNSGKTKVMLLLCYHDMFW